MHNPMPQPAAAVILVRDDRVAGLQVFMQVRHGNMSFAAGALVFPGGRVEPDDLLIAKDFSELRVGSLQSGEVAIGAAKVAAIREAFEESGYLLATRHGAPLTEAEREHLRTKYFAEANREPFRALLTRENLEPATSDLVHFAHWITPAGRPKRFDTQFFVAHADGIDNGGHDGTEAVDSMWLSPATALSGAEGKSYRLMFPTRLTLARIMRSASVNDLLAGARATPVVTVLPELVNVGGGQEALRLPPEAGYGSELFPLDEASQPRF